MNNLFYVKKYKFKIIKQTINNNKLYNYCSIVFTLKCCINKQTKTINIKINNLTIKTEYKF